IAIAQVERQVQVGIHLIDHPAGGHQAGADAGLARDNITAPALRLVDEADRRPVEAAVEVLADSQADQLPAIIFQRLVHADGYIIPFTHSASLASHRPMCWTAILGVD